jgi:hypothetical protein
MRLLIPALAVVALAGCASQEPMPVPTATPSPSGTPVNMLPLPGTDYLLDQLDRFADDVRQPSIRFSTAHIAGEGENFEFTLAEGTWLLRVSCATDASDSVDVALDFADGRASVEYEAYCGETPPTGIVSATTQGPEFAAGGAVGLVPAA